MALRADAGKQERWLDLVERWQRSKLTVREFCRRHQLSVSVRRTHLEAPGSMGGKGGALWPCVQMPASKNAGSISLSAGSAPNSRFANSVGDTNSAYPSGGRTLKHRVAWGAKEVPYGPACRCRQARTLA